MSTVRLSQALALVTDRAENSGFKIGLDGIESGTGRLRSTATTDFDGDGIEFCEGDLLFGKLRPYLAKTWLADRDGAAVGDFLVLRPKSTADSKFLNYLLLSDSFLEPITAAVTGAKMPRTDWTTVKAALVHLPPLVEQRAIADYLDQETAQIDALVAKQEEFIWLLRERRQDVIRIATGWGQPLPDGWRSSRLSHLFRSTGSGTTPANEDILGASGGDVAWVTTGELRERQIEATQKTISSSTLQKYSALKVYPAGTLLIAMYGATIGRTGLLSVPAATNQACCALVGPTGVSAEFVEYSLIAAREWLLLEASGGGQPNINQEKVRAFRIPVPPLDEQQSVVEYINGQVFRVDALIAKAEEHIALAKERRAALITAAVTGQFDVRTARRAG